MKKLIIFFLIFAMSFCFPLEIKAEEIKTVKEDKVLDAMKMSYERGEVSPLTSNIPSRDSSLTLPLWIQEFSGFRNSVLTNLCINYRLIDKTFTKT